MPRATITSTPTSTNTSPTDAAAADLDARERPARPLRVGLLMDSYVNAVWVARLIEQMHAAPEIELALVVMNTGDSGGGPAPRRSFLERVRRHYQYRDKLGHSLYHRFDRWRYARPEDPEHPADSSALLAPVATIAVTPRQTKFCDYFPDDAVASIRAHDVDVFIRFGFRILKGDALKIARYGVWSFHHGDNRVNRGGPAGFWEVADETPVTGAILQVLTEDLDAGAVLARSYSSTQTMSVTANKANFYWQATLLLLPVLRDVQRRGQAAIDEALGTSADWSAYTQRLYVGPRASEVVGMTARIGRRLVRSWINERLRQDQWFLAYRFASPSANAAGVPDGSFFRFKELMPPRDRIWADPMPARDGDRYWVFFEEFPFGQPIAHISAIELDRNGIVGEPRRVLERPYHLSYPFVFRWQDAWYMIPETFTQRAVELYRATSFPDGWELDRVLLADVDAVDATVVEVDGRWWMFTAMFAPGTMTEATALHLFHADSPLGPWTPHERNPVRVDVLGSRPAGPLFWKDGVLYRPGQDGTPRYGCGTIVFRVDELTPSRYRETAVDRIRPDWRPGLNGTHTLASTGALTVIDVRHAIRR